MSLTRDDAWAHLCDWTKTESLRKHARAVEIVMRRAAHRYGNGEVDEEAWGIAGMLHDADYEQWPEDHPNRIVAWLRDQDEEITRNPGIAGTPEPTRNRPIPLRALRSSC